MCLGGWSVCLFLFSFEDVYNVVNIFDAGNKPKRQKQYQYSKFAALDSIFKKTAH